MTSISGTLGLIGEVIGGVEHDLVAAAGADMKAQAALDAEVHQQIHHAAALENAADISRADIFRQLAAPDAKLGAQRDKSHAVGAEQLQIRRLGGRGDVLLQFLAGFAAFGETVGENDAGFDAFLADIFDDGKHGLCIDRDDGQRDFSRHIDDARIRFQSENFRPPRIDRHDLGSIEAEVLQVFKNIDGVMIAVAGADNSEAIGFEKRR